MVLRNSSTYSGANVSPPSKWSEVSSQSTLPSFLAMKPSRLAAMWIVTRGFAFSIVIYRRATISYSMPTRQPESPRSGKRLIAHLDTIEEPLSLEHPSFRMVLEQERLRTVPSDAKFGTATRTFRSGPVISISNEEIATTAWQLGVRRHKAGLCAEVCRGAAVTLEDHKLRSSVWGHILRHQMVFAHAREQIFERAATNDK